MSSNDFANTSQFDFIFDALANKYPAVKETDGKSTAFQFTASPMEANWKSGHDIAAYDFANSVSADLGGFFTPGPGPLYNAYKELIYSIEPSNRSTNDNYQEYQTNLSALNSQKTTLYGDIQTNYATYKKNGGEESSSEWLQDIVGGKEFQDQLDRLEKKIDTVNGQINQLVKSMDGALGSAQNNLTEDKLTYKLSNGQDVEKPRIIIEGDLGGDLSRWTGYDDDEYDLDVIISKDSEIKSPWRKTYDTKVKHHCLKTSVETEVNVSRIIADKHYKLEVKFKGLQSYNIKLGDWFSQTYVNPETAKFPDGGTVDSNTFFGTNGSIHMLPSQVWVAYRPKIELTITTDLYREQYSAMHKSGVNWLNIFGFKFNFDAEASLKPIHNDDNNTTKVTFESPADSNPYVLGLTSLVRYNGEKAD